MIIWKVVVLKKGCWRRCYYLEGHLSTCPAQPTYGYADRPLRGTESNPFLWGLLIKLKLIDFSSLLRTSYNFSSIIPPNVGRCNPLTDLTLGLFLFSLRKFDENFLRYTVHILLLLKAKLISRIYHHPNNIVNDNQFRKSGFKKTYQKKKKNRAGTWSMSLLMKTLKSKGELGEGAWKKWPYTAHRAVVRSVSSY